MADILEAISYKNAPNVTGTITAPSGGGGGGSWGTETTAAPVVTPAPVETPTGNVKPLIISTPDEAKKEVANIQTQLGTITQNQQIAQQTAAQKKAEETALYEKNPYWVRPGEKTDAYNARIAEMRAGGVIPPAETTSEVDQKIKEAGGVTDFTAENTILADEKKRVEAENKKLDEDYVAMQTSLDNAYAGKDITPEQKAELDLVNQKFNDLKELQITANKNYEGGVTAMGLVSGRSRYAPELEAGNIQSAVNSGISKLNSLEAERARTINELKQAFITKNVEKIQKAWENYSKVTSQKATNLKELNAKLSEAEKAQREWNYKVAQDSITNAFNNNKFSWEQKQDILKNTLEQNKFDYQKTQDLRDYALKQEELQIKRDEIANKKVEAQKSLQIAGLNPDDPNYLQNMMALSSGGKPVDVATRTKISKGLLVLSQLTELQKNIKNADTGPIIGILRSANPWDTKAQLISAQLTSIVPNLARGTYGEVGVLTDNDVALYSKTLPNIKSTEELRNAVLAMTVKTVQRSIETELQIAAGTGLDVAGLKNVWERVKTQSDALNQSLGINPQDSDLNEFYASKDEATQVAIENFVKANPDATDADIINKFK